MYDYNSENCLISLYEWKDEKQKEENKGKQMFRVWMKTCLTILLLNSTERKKNCNINYISQNSSPAAACFVHHERDESQKII